MALSKLVEFAKQRRDEASRQYEEAQKPKPLPQQPRIDPPVQSTQRQAPPITISTNPPPLPEVRPMATPVMDLKRETANYWNFSPEARTELYDTPTRVNYRGYDHKPAEEPQGYYRPPGWDYSAPGSGNHQIMVQEPHGGQPYEVGSTTGDVTWPSLGSGTLAHEFGHKWDFEHVPQGLRDEWYGKEWVQSPTWTPGTSERFVNDYQSGAIDRRDWQLLGQETYANTIMQNQTPGLQMQPWMRDKYFVGLFNDSARQWQPPSFDPSSYYKPPPPTSDILRERDVRFMPPDENGNLG